MIRSTRLMPDMAVSLPCSGRWPAHPGTGRGAATMPERY
jgi:hypothetical protein